jgi:pimeloyl-ACP methyl ester carboxylesterase
MGSELFFGEELVWPGPVSSLIFPYTKMEKLLRLDLRVGDVIRNFAISEQYGALIRDLRVFGFKEEDRTLFLQPYDWRRSNALAAEGLANGIDEAVDSVGSMAEITLIAHSMGGLVSRWYLESGRFTDRPGFHAVRRLITLGTPHLGAPLALTAALGKEKRLFLSATQVRQLVGDPRYPSLYELLPPRGEPFAWSLDPGSDLAPIDVYDLSIAAKLGLLQANLGASQTFRAGLDHTRRPNGVRYFSFVGSRQSTIAAVTVDFQTVDPVRPVEAEDGGDGTVPIWSGALSGLQSRPVGGEHGTIYKNDDLRRTLGLLLGYEGTLAAVERVEVAVRERVIEPVEPLHVALSISSGTNDLKGDLRLSRAELDEQGSLLSYTRLAPTYPIHYEGICADRINVVLEAPEFAGVYKLEFCRPDGQIFGEDEFFVQEPPV